MFEDRTYENLMAECLANAPPGTDIRPDSIFYDAVASSCLKIAQFYADLNSLFDLVFVTTAVGEYLDRRGQEFAVYRTKATYALYEYTWTGTKIPEIGTRFFNGSSYFTLCQDERIWPFPYLKSETPGSGSNNILSGTSAIPLQNIQGLATSTFGTLIEPGADTESDDNYRRRIMEKIGGPAENGNRQHYKTWAESIKGVGRARIKPLFAGENTVMATIINTDGLPATQSVIDRVQEYIDPITLGLTVDVDGEIVKIGDALGDGKANIGAHFAAVAPYVLEVNINFSAELAHGADKDRIKLETSQAIAEHFKYIALNTPESQPMTIRVSVISSILHSQTGLVDYTNLTLNGDSGNITLTDRQVAVLGSVTFDVI